MYKKSLHWFRRDLRLTDNRALSSAFEKSKCVLLCFIFDTHILNRLKNKKDARVEFILNSLKFISKQLKQKKSKLFILNGKPELLIPEICKKFHLSAVFTNEDYECYAKKRDQKVKKILKSQNIHFHSFKDHVIFGSEVLKEDGSAYRVFTPYKKAWLNKLNPSEDLKIHNSDLNKLFPIKSKNWELKDLGFKKTDLFLLTGEKEAQKQLKKFSRSIHKYHQNRDYPYRCKNSHLSVHLRFGTLSIRSCVRMALKKKNPGSESWLSELIWREFYSMILDQFPHIEKQAFKKKYQNIKWHHNEKWFQAWCRGQTGFPIVDAGMRQLNQTGFMPNRLRMITASFLVKDLLIDWRKGERYFADKLLDFDLASNNGGWQWCAGTGCDAQPYFRIFNPITQSQKFDPQGKYIKNWVKELRNLDVKKIHFPKKYQKELPLQLGKDYPLPLVDHKTQRQKIIKKFKRSG